MNKKIIVAIDGSDSSKRAVQFAMNLGKSFAAELVLFTVTQTNPFDADAEFQFPEEKRKKLRAKIEKSRFGQYEELISNYEPVSYVGIDSKNIVEAIVDYLGTNTAEMLIMGRTGTSTFQKLLGGSVSHGMLELSPIPVCIVP